MVSRWQRTSDRWQSLGNDTAPRDARRERTCNRRERRGGRGDQDPKRQRRVERHAHASEPVPPEVPRPSVASSFGPWHPPPIFTSVTQSRPPCDPDVRVLAGTRELTTNKSSSTMIANVGLSHRLRHGYDRRCRLCAGCVRFLSDAGDATRGSHSGSDTSWPEIHMQRVGLRFVEYVNDPIWGEIPLTKVELDLVNSKPFRRLQHIRQMGLAYLAFPTANHRRYEHCIGAMHVAYLLADMLAELAASNPDLHIEIGPAHYQAIRLAALLHDIGHAPYSHAFEESAKRHPALCEFRNKAVFRKQFSPLSPLLSGGTHYSHELFTNYLIQSHPEVSDPARLGSWRWRLSR